MKQLAFPGHTLDDQIRRSIDTLKAYEPKNKPYWGCFSGGKDSVVIKEIARLSGVNVEWHYNVTTIDPPELVYFIREHHKDVKFERPKRNFFTAMPINGIPTRRLRWCCREFKESKSPKGAVLIFGVRAAESPRRAKTWQTMTANTKTKGYVVSPILYWSDAQVWEFIHIESLPYCKLYDEGFKRLGCIGCPSAGSGRIEQFKRWPNYEKKWKKGCKAVFDRRQGKEWFGAKRFKTWEELWEWWLSDNGLPKEECQGITDLFSR